MGFLDKAKQAAQQAEAKLNSATSGMNQGQQSRAADAWLKELGQWTYAERMGRDPRAAAEVEVRIQQIQQWEQQSGSQVSTPIPSPGTGGAASAPTGPGVAPESASIPGTFAPPADAPPASIPGTFAPPEDTPPASIPGTFSSPPDAPLSDVPTPGPSLGGLDGPAVGEPLTPPPPPAAPTASPPAAEPPTEPVPPSPPGPPPGLASPPG